MIIIMIIMWNINEKNNENILLIMKMIIIVMKIIIIIMKIIIMIIIICNNINM